MKAGQVTVLGLLVLLMMSFLFLVKLHSETLLVTVDVDMDEFFVPAIFKELNDSNNFPADNDSVNITNASTSSSQRPLFSSRMQETIRRKFAYAFVIGGCNPEDARYRGFIYNILVTARLLREMGSRADVVAFIQLSKDTEATTLPEEDLTPLHALNVTVKYVPKAQLESFYDTVMNKFRILTLTEYDRVLLLDGDVMPISNLDYLFELSVGEHAILRENFVVNGPWEPANGGFFMLEPGEGRYDEITEIIRRREESSKNVVGWAGHTFDVAVGWGHVITPPDQWIGRRERGNNWTFHFAFSDQGLLYYYTKYYKKSVSMYLPEKVENWHAGPDGEVALQEVIQHPFKNYSKPILRDMGACHKFLCDYIHFSGTAKPWLKKPPTLRSSETRLKSGHHLWWYTLDQINTEVGMGLDLDNWETGRLRRPPLGLYATFRDMDARVNARNVSDSNMTNATTTEVSS